ncbi:17664_t:CDS:2 [Funneliformis caledonium]|uniref:17664_t:CDS:1 n=1 Tax=Funneliformis caledonium TaxID=1117310 RepID=A0A9N9CEB7_9GLOM|nr:17664_t:CDS:2 [Funneliformis caledonium]
MDPSTVFSIFPLKDLTASISNSGRSFATEVMNVITLQFILQHTMSIAKSFFLDQIIESFIKLRSFQQEYKGIMTRYNFTIQEALYLRNLPFQIIQINITGCELILGELLAPIYETIVDKLLIDCLVRYYELVYANIEYTFYSEYGKHDKKDHFNISRRKILDGAVQNGTKYVELWRPLTKKISHKSIIPVQRIVCQFMKVNYHPQNSQIDSIAVIPLNRRFSI